MTSDGVVVVTHDETLQRLLHCEQRVSDCCYELLLSRCKRSGHPPVPTLDSVFASFPHTPIHLDVKQHDEQLMQVTSTIPS
jgi:glycerophosphoryl diester phosphodiesterase